MSFNYSNEDLIRITGTASIRNYIHKQQLKFLAHVCRMNNNDMRKQILFAIEAKNSQSIWSVWEKVLNIDRKQIWNTMMDKDKFFDFLNKINLYQLLNCIHVLRLSIIGNKRKRKVSTNFPMLPIRYIHHFFLLQIRLCCLEHFISPMNGQILCKGYVICIHPRHIIRKEITILKVSLANYVGNEKLR